MKMLTRSGWSPSNDIEVIIKRYKFVKMVGIIFCLYLEHFDPN